VEKIKKMKLNKFYQQIARFEYKTPSVFGALVIMTILFVLLILGVQSDPIKAPMHQGRRSPTGTIE
jgi:hypothetical protein